MKKQQLNIVFSMLASLCAVFLLIITAKAATIDSISLEQKIRCHTPAHMHTDACYENDILICTKKEHVHAINCYLVLLSDNDIDVVMDETEDTLEKTLESVIENAVDSALVYNDIDAKQKEVLEFNETLISELNDTIRSEEEIPPLILNENLNKSDLQLLQFYDEDTADFLYHEFGEAPILAKEAENQQSQPTIEPDWVLPEDIEPPAASTEAVNVNPSTANNKANIYIQLNNSWNCIGTVNTSTSGNRTIAGTDINNLLNQVDNSTYTTNSYSVFYATSVNGTYKKATLSNGRYTFTNNRIAWYVHLYANNATATSGTPLKYYTVLFNYPDGTSKELIVKSGYVLTFSGSEYADYDWKDDTAKTYSGSDTLTVTKRITLNGTRKQIGPDPEAEAIEIQYALSFPSVSGVTVSKRPTIASSGSENYTVSISKLESLTVEDVSQRIVLGLVNNNGTGLQRAIRLSGWRVGTTNTILQPGATISWDSLLQYATGTTVKLYGVWEYHTSQTCSFFIRYDSVAVDIEGNIQSQDSNLYTKQLHCTFIANIDTSKSTTDLTQNFGVADVTADNSFTADKNIRALVTESADRPYFYTFPDDEDVFRQLASYTDHLQVDGIPVKAEDLNSDGYAIRWYVFKCQSDAWHIDGKLVRKEGTLRVKKTFAGNKLAIAQAKNSFYITVNGERLGAKTLRLNNATSYDANTETYTWDVGGMSYNEKLTIRENGYQVNHYRVYSEYSIDDALGKYSTDSVQPYTGEINLLGMTYAVDTGLEEVMQVNLTNVYYGSDSLVIKKLDEDTGNSLAGAEFELWQHVSIPIANDTPVVEINDPINPPAEEMTVTEEEIDDAPEPTEEDAVAETTEEPSENEVLEDLSDIELEPEPLPLTAEEETLVTTVEEEYEEPSVEPQADTETEQLLHFRLDAATGAYVYDPSGDVTRLTANNGFYEVSIAGISLDLGDITVKEVVVPEGYTPVEAIVLTKGSDNTIVVKDNAATIKDNVLFVPNSSHTVTISAQKEWNCEERHWKPVTIQLLANGHLVTTLYPALADQAVVVLSADNGWSYTWENLPMYANGGRIEWTVREIRVGDERIRDTGDFLNYLVDYSEPIYGMDFIHLRITNDLRRIMLRVIKTNWDGSKALEGATYLLQKLVEQPDGSYAVDPTADTIQLTSNSSGVMVFEGIQYGRYLLSEIKAPKGYYLGDPIELTLNEDGTITVWSGSAIYNMVKYNLVVRDLEQVEIVETGSNSERNLYCFGIAIFLLLTALLFIEKWRCKYKA